MIQTKIQTDAEDYAFVKKSYKELKYRSLSDSMRSAIRDKIQEDRRKLRQISREKAMEMIGQAGCGDVFESLEGEDFERR